MIGKLTGIVDSVAQDHALIDVGGVGYVVFASQSTLGKLPHKQTASMLIETHVREDHIHLYGFLSVAERDWFRILTSVQGVGSKVGLGILSLLSPDHLTTAIAAQDKTALQRAEGVGPKLAARLLTELKDRAPLSLSSAPFMTANATEQDNSIMSDAVSALVNLGYTRSDAYTVAGTILQKTPDADLPAVIRQSLAQLSGAARAG